MASIKMPDQTGPQYASTNKFSATHTKQISQEHSLENYVKMNLPSKDGNSIASKSKEQQSDQETVKQLDK